MRERRRRKRIREEPMRGAEEAVSIEDLVKVRKWRR